VGRVSVMEFMRRNMTTLSSIPVFRGFNDRCAKRDRLDSPTFPDSSLSLFFASFMRASTLSIVFSFLFRSQSYNVGYAEEVQSQKVEVCLIIVQLPNRQLYSVVRTQGPRFACLSSTRKRIIAYS
jgi:hypothetical protein